MKYKVPSFLYLIKAFLFVVMLVGLFFLEDTTLAVLFVVVVAIELGEMYIVNRFLQSSIGVYNSVVFAVMDRVIVLLPLLFECINNVLAVWVFILVVALDIVVVIYRFLNYANPRLRKLIKAVCVVYNLLMYASVVTFLSNMVTVAVYLLFASNVSAGVSVIISSIIFALSDKDVVESEDPAEEPKKTLEVSDIANKEIIE